MLIVEQSGDYQAALRTDKQSAQGRGNKREFAFARCTNIRDDGEGY